MQNQKYLKIKAIISDHETEFMFYGFTELSDKIGISHTFSAARTPHQNGVA